MNKVRITILKTTLDSERRANMASRGSGLVR